MYTHTDDFDEEMEDYDDEGDIAHFDGGDYYRGTGHHGNNNDNQLGASSSLLRPADSRSQSVFCMYLELELIFLTNSLLAFISFNKNATMLKLVIVLNIKTKIDLSF